MIVLTCTEKPGAYSSTLLVAVAGILPLRYQAEALAAAEAAGLILQERIIDSPAEIFAADA